MTIAKLRSWMYPLAKYLGDVQAVQSKRKGSISRRVTRRLAGKITGRTIMRGIGRMFK